MLNHNRYEVLTFDCYGTLIDWEKGILSTLQPILDKHHITLPPDRVLELYAELEAELESGSFIPYEDVLRRVMQGLGLRLGFTPSPAELNGLVESLPAWPPFPDTVPALQALKQRYRLAVISNIDDHLFALSNRLLQVTFDWIITAEQVGSYKPSLRNFHVALERIGLPLSHILHVAQSLYHDIAPARQLGLATVWVNRRKGLSGWGATPPANAQPDLEVPDLQTLVSLLDSL